MKKPILRDGEERLKMNEFKKYNPFVIFIYFVFIIGAACFIMHPISLFLSFFSALFYMFILKGVKSLKSLLYILPMMIFMAILNPLFNHEGVTTLLYFPNGNPLTKEAVLYGLFAAVMIAAVIFWFSCFNEIMTSDKIMYIFGKILPSLSLVFSMTLRFVPDFFSKLKEIRNVQRFMGNEIEDKSIIKRAKSGIKILSAMITYAFESAIDTADSMKSRGFGYKKRTLFSIFTFDRRDKILLMVVFCLALYIIIGKLAGGMYFKFFPSIKMGELSFFSLTVFLAYFVLLIYPLLIELREVRRWKV